MATKEALQNMGEICIEIGRLIRSEEKYCDVTIKVQQHLFKSSRLLLSSVSQYFDAMFFGTNFKERNMRPDEPIVLHDIDAIAFEKILHFLYSGSIEVTDYSVYTLLKACDFLHLRISSIQEQCVQYLQDHVYRDEPMSHALEISAFACLTERDVIIEIISQHIAKHLDHFLRNIEFVHISYDSLKAILKHGKCSEHSLRAVIQWVNHDRKERKKYRSKLLFRKIDYKLVPKKFMVFMLNQYEGFVDRDREGVNHTDNIAKFLKGISNFDHDEVDRRAYSSVDTSSEYSE